MSGAYFRADARHQDSGGHAKTVGTEGNFVEVALAADAGRSAGLGHLGRTSAIGVALRTRGAEVACLGLGLRSPLELDGLLWEPTSATEALAVRAGALVVDSYGVPRDQLELAGARVPLVVFDDSGDPPLSAALVVDVVAEEATTGRVLGGFRYAALRTPFWGLPDRNRSDSVARVLVSTGGGDAGRAGIELALSVARVLPKTEVTLVRGAGSGFQVPPGLQVADAPNSLLRLLLEADLAVCAGGQTMLEAVATGTACVAVGVAENQRRQAMRLAELGAVAWVDEPDPAKVANTVVRLSQDADERWRLSRAGQNAVDGLGALRVAFHVARLAELGR